MVLDSKDYLDKLYDPIRLKNFIEQKVKFWCLDIYVIYLMCKNFEIIKHFNINKFTIYSKNKEIKITQKTFKYVIKY